jgi:DNA mismatch repair protein MutS
LKDSLDFVANLEKQERARTGIPSLKIKFNQVFGYYIEITKANLNSIPDNYFRKQTLVNAERFITQELKEKEELILSAEEKTKAIEFEIFQELVQEIIKNISEIQACCHQIAVVDCILNFANLAITNRYIKPTISSGNEINIKSGRHPVVEKLLEFGDFVPNDIYLDHNSNQLQIITGPNMGGKSVYIRQVALICLMAQIGSFVPAKEATLSIVDKIFVRSGANDVIASGLSTFMVEMLETAYILNHATSKSLIVLDEIGRGTSTYDGISIAWAVAEHLVSDKTKQPKTLFATHYHELQKLEALHPTSIKKLSSIS